MYNMCMHMYMHMCMSSEHSSRRGAADRERGAARSEVGLHFLTGSDRPINCTSGAMEGEADAESITKGG